MRKEMQIPAGDLVSNLYSGGMVAKESRGMKTIEVASLLSEHFLTTDDKGARCAIEQCFSWALGSAQVTPRIKVVIARCFLQNRKLLSVEARKQFVSFEAEQRNNEIMYEARKQ